MVSMIGSTLHIPANATERVKLFEDVYLHTHISNNYKGLIYFSDENNHIIQNSTKLIVKRTGYSTLTTPMVHGISLYELYFDSPYTITYDGQEASITLKQSTQCIIEHNGTTQPKKLVVYYDYDL